LPVGVRNRKGRTDTPRESCGPAYNPVACRSESRSTEHLLDWTRRHCVAGLGAHYYRTVRTTDQLGRDGRLEQAVHARLLDVLPDIRCK
jgi:hypothetical protein